MAGPKYHFHEGKTVLKRVACEACKAKGRDSHNDNKIIYSDGGWWCFVCARGKIDPNEDKEPEIYESNEEEELMEFGAAEWNKLKAKSSKYKTGVDPVLAPHKGYGFRGISDDTYKLFGVLNEILPLEEGEEPQIYKQHYPILKDIDGTPQISGVKTREVSNKKFSVKGENKQKSSLLFGQFLAQKSSKKTVVITSGECFTGDTEVLTDQGFVRLDKFDIDSHHILAVGNDGDSSRFTKALAYIDKPYKGDLVVVDDFEAGYHVKCTPDHNLAFSLGVTHQLLNKYKAKEPIFPHAYFRTSVDLDYNFASHLQLTEKKLILAAYLASSEVSITLKGKIYTCTYTERVEELPQIFDKAGVKYTQWDDNELTFYSYDFIAELHENDWNFPTLWLLHCTGKQRKAILNTFIHIYSDDGECLRIPDNVLENFCRNTLDYITHLSDVAYEVLHEFPEEKEEGYSKVQILPPVRAGKTLEISRSVERYEGRVYCVQSPSGFILIRSKGCVIVVGNCDAMASYEMLQGLGNDCPVFVSSTVGEAGIGQYQAQYEFFDKFERIVIIPDQDKAGQEALKKAVQALPRGKVYVVDLPMKDPNDMLMKGFQNEFIIRYKQAKPFVPDGVLGSGELFEKIVDLTEIKKVPLPPFLSRLEDMLAGGFALESIVNLISSSGAGKCLAKGTKVWTHDFRKVSVEDIKPGDKLLRPDGSYNTVLSLGRGRSVMYKVDQSSGMSYTVNSEHILSLKNLNNEVVNIPIKDFINSNENLKGYKASFENRVEINPALSDLVVTELPEDDYYGFTLDGDHLFCLEDFTVTHNTTYVNELIYYWLFNSPYKVGILTMELSAPQYGQVLLSRHLEKKLSIMTQEEQREYLAQEEVQAKADELFKTPDGSNRFFLVDERTNDPESMQKLLEQLIISAGCRVLIIDPIQDVQPSSDLAGQNEWMAWEKAIVKQYGVLIFNVCHTRKNLSSGKSGSHGASLSEEDTEGSSTIVKSAKINLLFTRNKLAEDPIERNTTSIEISKNRDNGVTGKIAEIYYDNDTHRLYDLEEYKRLHPEKFVEEIEGDIDYV